MKKIIFLLLSCTFLLGENIHIAVAANMGHAIEALKTEFLNKRNGDTITIALASSGKLSAQIKNGAPYAMFLSANMQYAQNLFNEGCTTQKPTIYARGVLVIFSKQKRDLAKPFQLLTKKNIHKIAIANPKTAPYGKAAMEALKSSSYYNQIEPKLVYGASISQTFSFALKATDIGFIAKSALHGKDMKKYKENENYIDVKQKFYTPLDQGMVILKHYETNKLATDFFNFLQTKKAKKILKKYGYFVNE